MGELGVGRGQIELLASLFHPKHRTTWRRAPTTTTTWRATCPEPADAAALACDGYHNGSSGTGYSLASGGTPAKGPGTLKDRVDRPSRARMRERCRRSVEG